MSKTSDEKNQLSNETIAQYREVFTLFDRDGDGLITPKELVNVLKDFGLDPTENEMLSLIKRVEIDSDSVIDFDEFLSLMTSKAGEEGKEDDEDEELREAFKMFDRDGNGFLDMAELEDLFTNLNEKLTQQEFQSAVKLIDIDGDGRIDYFGKQLELVSSFTFIIIQHSLSFYFPTEFKQFIIASK